MQAVKLVLLLESTETGMNVI